MIADRDTTVGYHCPACGLPILNPINIFSMSGNLIKLKCVCGNSELVVQMLKDSKFKVTVPCILCPHSHSFTLSSVTFFQKDLFSLSCKFTALNICFIGKDKKVYDALKKNEEELIKTFAAYEEEYGELPADLLDENGYFDEDEFDDFDEFDEFDDDYDDFDELDDFDEFGGNFRYEPKEPGFILHKNSDFYPNSDSSEDNNDIEIVNMQNKEIDDIENIKISSYQIVIQILDIISQLYDKKKIFCKCGNLDGKVVILSNAIHIECKNCDSYRNIKAAYASDVEYLTGVESLYLDFDDT